MHKLIGVVLSFAIIGGTYANDRCATVVIRGERELWIGGNRIIRDDRGVNAPRWSPSGQQLAYVNDFDLSGDPVSHIVVIDRAGHVSQTVSIPASAMFNAVDQMGWLNSTTIWIDGHVSPSAGVYDEFDLTTREMRHETPGLFFAPSPDGQTLAYCEPERRPARPDDRPSLMLNKTSVRLPEALSVTGSLVWSPNGERLAVAVQKNGRAGVAFITARGIVDRISMLPANGRTYALVWASDSSVLVRPNSQKDTYRVTSDGKVEESKTTLAIEHRDETCRAAVAAQ